MSPASEEGAGGTGVKRTSAGMLVLFAFGALVGHGAPSASGLFGSAALPMLDCPTPEGGRDFCDDLARPPSPVLGTQIPSGLWTDDQRSAFNGVHAQGLQHAGIPPGAASVFSTWMHFGLPGHDHTPLIYFGVEGSRLSYNPAALGFGALLYALGGLVLLALGIGVRGYDRVERLVGLQRSRIRDPSGLAHMIGRRLVRLAQVSILTAILLLSLPHLAAWALAFFVGSTLLVSVGLVRGTHRYVS